MATECIPLYEHGATVTMLASVAVSGKTFVELDATAGVDNTTGLFQAQLPSDGGTVAGVAGRDTPLGGQIPVLRGKSAIVPVTAGATVTAGEFLSVNQFGQVVPLAAAVAAAPAITKGSTGSSGGTFSAGTYFWVVTSEDAGIESAASNEITATLVANGEQAISWSAVSGADHYNIYRGAAAGQESVLVATITGTSYTDTGIAGTAGAPPNAAAVVGVVVGRAWSSAITGGDVFVALEF